MYILAVILIGAIFFSDYRNYIALRNSVTLIFLLWFSVLVYFRPEYNLNTDYSEYLSFFSTVTVGNFREIGAMHGFEIGFSFFSALIKTLTGSERFCFSIIAFLTLYIAYLALLKLSKYVGYSLIIYFLSLCVYVLLGQIRQGISISLGLLAISFWLDTKYKSFFAAVLIASLFHITAFILLLIPILRYFNLRFLYCVCLVSFSFVFVDVFKSAIPFLVTHINLGGFASGKLTAYSNSAYAETVGFAPIQIYYLVLVSLLVFYSNTINNERFNFMLKVFIVGVILNFSLNSFNVLLRLTYYFLVFDCVLISYFIFKLKSFHEKIFVHTLFLAIFILRFYLQWMQWINK